MPKTACKGLDFDACACSGRTLGKLVRPCILALLARGPAHGYALLEQLNESGLLAVGTPDHSVVYRTLNAMEKEGLLESVRRERGGGPTRWEYSLTADGRSCLGRWQTSLTAYRTAIDGLLRLMS